MVGGGVTDQLQPWARIADSKRELSCIFGHCYTERIITDKGGTTRRTSPRARADAREPNRSGAELQRARGGGRARPWAPPGRAGAQFFFFFFFALFFLTLTLDVYLSYLRLSRD